MVSSISSKPTFISQVSQQSTVAKPAEVGAPSAAPVDANKAAQLLRNSMFGQDSFQTAGGRGPVNLGQTEAAAGADLGGLGEMGKLLSDLFEKLSSGDTSGAQESLANLLKAFGIQGADNTGETGAEEAVGSTDASSDSGALEGASGAEDTGEADGTEGIESLLQTLSELATKNPELLKQLVQNPELLKAVVQNPQVLGQLTQNPEQATSLTGADSSKGANPLAELSGLSRFLGSGNFSPNGI